MAILTNIAKKLFTCFKIITVYVALKRHPESGEGLWLQGEAELQTHSFRNAGAEPEPVIQSNEKKIYSLSPEQVTQGKTISLTNTDPSITSVAYQGIVVCYARSSELRIYEYDRIPVIKEAYLV